mgnify:CR=1 FL=1
MHLRPRDADKSLLLLLSVAVFSSACGDLQPADDFAYLSEAKWLEAQNEPKDIAIDAAETDEIGR